MLAKNSFFKMHFKSTIAKFGILIFLNLVTVVFGLFEQCNHIVDLKAGKKIFISSPFYPNPYPANTACRYTLTAPRDYQLDFKCNIDINVNPASSTAQLTERCYDEIFYFNREGSELLTSSEYFCGHGNMERKSFLNRAVISYISMRPPRNGPVGAGVEVFIKIGMQLEAASLNGTATQLNVGNSSGDKQPFNMVTAHYNNRATLPLANYVTASAQLGFTNAFAYLTQLLSNGLETSVFMATPRPTAKAHKNTKCKGNRRKVTKSTRRVAAPATSTDLFAHSLEPRLPINGRNSANSLTSTAAARNKTTPLAQRDFRIVSNQPMTYDGYPSGAGNGRFTCLVEAVESPCDCGWSTYSVKVVSPTGASGVNEFTSMAGVLTLNAGKIFCGAVIIHHRFLLSAAHCFISVATNRSELIQVVVGEHDLSTVLESVYTRYYKIDAILLHENFRHTANQLRNDIALLRTRQPIEWNRGVAPTCLPFRSSTGTDGAREPPTAGQRLETAGWGSISFGGPQSSLLLTTQLDVIGAGVCRGSLGALPPATFCTFTPGRDTCQYDSGGGLYLREGGRLFVVGIVSYGYGCAARRPSVNTKVASYIRWIKSKTAHVTYCIK